MEVHPDHNLLVDFTPSYLLLIFSLKSFIQKHAVNLNGIHYKKGDNCIFVVSSLSIGEFSGKKEFASEVQIIFF